MTTLTDLAIRKFPVPGTGRKIYWDQGLGLRVSYSGSKTFVVKHQGTFKTIGKYPAMSLKTAREEALRFKLADHTTKTVPSFSEALSAFLKETAVTARPSTVDGYWYRLKGITKTDLSAITPTDLPATPQHTMAGKVFFNWCVRQGYLEKNPRNGTYNSMAPPSILVGLLFIGVVILHLYDDQKS